MQKIKPIINVLPHQSEFINSNNKHPILVGGYGCGKSHGIVCRTLGQLVKRKGNGTVIIGAPTYTLAKDVNIPDFEDFLDTYQIPYKLHKSDHKIYIKGKSLKGEIWFRSYDRPERWVGFEATDCLLDEFDTAKLTQQKLLWQKAVARMRKCANSTLGIATTPEGFRFTYELAVERGVGHLIKAKTTDNIYLPPDYIDSLYDQYDALLVDQYINGEFVNINGHAAYYAFNRDKNVFKDSIDDLLRITNIKHGVDFNVNPMCAVHAVKTGGILYIFDEAYLKNSNTERLAEVIKEKFPDKDNEFASDMTGIKRSSSASIGVTDINILKKVGRISGSHNPFVRDRLNMVNNALSKGKVRIHESCTYLIRDLEQVVVDEHGEIDKSDMNLTHISDAAGYLICREYPMTTQKLWKNAI